MPQGIEVNREILMVVFGYGLEKPLHGPCEPGRADYPPVTVLHRRHPDAEADEEEVKR
jgi:hypothetical protein